MDRDDRSCSKLEAWYGSAPYLLAALMTAVDWALYAMSSAGLNEEGIGLSINVIRWIWGISLIAMALSALVFGIRRQWPIWVIPWTVFALLALCILASNGLNKWVKSGSFDLLGMLVFLFLVLGLSIAWAKWTPSASTVIALALTPMMLSALYMEGVYLHFHYAFYLFGYVITAGITFTLLRGLDWRVGVLLAIGFNFLAGGIAAFLGNQYGLMLSYTDPAWVSYLDVWTVYLLLGAALLLWPLLLRGIWRMVRQSNALAEFGAFWILPGLLVNLAGLLGSYWLVWSNQHSQTAVRGLIESARWAGLGIYLLGIALMSVGLLRDRRLPRWLVLVALLVFLFALPLDSSGLNTIQGMQFAIGLVWLVAGVWFIPYLSNFTIEVALHDRMAAAKN